MSIFQNGISKMIEGITSGAIQIYEKVSSQLLVEELPFLKLLPGIAREKIRGK